MGLRLRKYIELRVAEVWAHNTDTAHRRQSLICMIALLLGCIDSVTLKLFVLYFDTILFYHILSICLWPYFAVVVHFYSCYASAVLAVVVCLSVRLSLCLYVTNRHCIKTAKCRITQTMQCDIPGTVGFWCQNSRRNSNRIILMRASNRGGVGSNGDFWPISCYFSETVQDRYIVTMEC